MANYNVRQKPKGPDGKSRKKDTKKSSGGGGVMDGVTKDFTDATTAAKDAGLYPTLDTLDTTRDASMADPNSPNYVGKRSDEMKSILNIMQQGLAGLSAPENQALREQAQRSLDTQYQTSLRQQQLSAARGGVRGAAASAQAANLDQSRINAQGNLEQDLAVKNIDIQDKRRSEYANQLGGQEKAEFGRVKDATDRLNKDNLVNLYQSNAQTASRVGAVAGILGYGTAKKNTANELKLAKKGQAMGMPRQPVGGGGGNPMQPLIDATNKLVDTKYGAGTSASV